MFDDKESRRAERIYLTPDIVEQRARVLEAMALQRGERVADLGHHWEFCVWNSGNPARMRRVIERPKLLARPTLSRNSIANDFESKAW